MMHSQVQLEHDRRKERPEPSRACAREEFPVHNAEMIMREDDAAGESSGLPHSLQSALWSSMDPRTRQGRKNITPLPLPHLGFGSFWLRLRNSNRVRRPFSLLSNFPFLLSIPLPHREPESVLWFNSILLHLVRFNRSHIMAARLPLARLSAQRLTTLTRPTRAPSRLRIVQGLSTLTRSNASSKASGLLRVSSG